jgi:PKD repeat protein
VVAPWISWGPYIWADGLNPRSDGFIWECGDVRQNDFTHPSSNGVFKVAAHLLAFFKTDPTTAPWFLRKSIVGQAPSCRISADVTNGVAPLAVSFSAMASDSDGTIRDYQWTFDDGTFSTNANPTKIFKTPGVYTVKLTVTDNDGNTAARSLVVTVTAVALGNLVFDLNRVQLALFGATNYDFVVQQSDNLSDWLPVITNRGPFTFTETNPSSPRRFFRAILQP